MLQTIRGRRLYLSFTLLTASSIRLFHIACYRTRGFFSGRKRLSYATTNVNSSPSAWRRPTYHLVCGSRLLRFVHTLPVHLPFFLNVLSYRTPLDFVGSFAAVSLHGTRGFVAGGALPVYLLQRLSIYRLLCCRFTVGFITVHLAGSLL